jgi:hypothetical protein
MFKLITREVVYGFRSEIAQSLSEGIAPFRQISPKNRPGEAQFIDPPPDVE